MNRELLNLIVLCSLESEHSVSFVNFTVRENNDCNELRWSQTALGFFLTEINFSENSSMSTALDYLQLRDTFY